VSNQNITVLDISQTAIDVTKKRQGLAAEQVHGHIGSLRRSIVGSTD
jgi:hypothetical protein